MRSKTYSSFLVMDKDANQHASPICRSVNDTSVVFEECNYVFTCMVAYAAVRPRSDERSAVKAVS